MIKDLSYIMGRNLELLAKKRQMLYFIFYEKVML